MRNVIKEGTFSRPIHSRARMIKDAIGVALITVRTGEKSAFAFFDRCVITAIRTATKAPDNRPERILSTD